MSRDNLTETEVLRTLLGPGSRFEGKLTFEGRIRIEGEFSGEIFSDDVLIVSEDAEVRADIEVGTLIVRGGSVWGNVRASRLVEIHAPGRVHGDIRAPQFFLDKGAHFEGNCTMSEEEAGHAAEASPAVEQEIAQK